MTNTLDTIWDGDKLKRRGEARMLETFLAKETETLRLLRRDQSFVLAIDAQYGEGKSWFLTRFRNQLEINHPVAFVDAWVDDGNSEPLVSIMAALEDAMRPFLKKRGVKEKLGALSRAALPIMGKAAVGAAGQLAKKYLGQEIGDTAQAAVASAAKKDDFKDSPAGAGLEKLVDGISEVVDNAGKAMLAQYRARQKSRETFKTNLRALAAAIDGSGDDNRTSPIFVIVDELDRCRPIYAISLLEEIKHLFDVPGVVFLIALHGEQLIHSINAVYGAEFNGRAYLRRFFSRTYALRRLSIKELVISHFDAISKETIFSSPPLYKENAVVEVPAAQLTGDLLTEWLATPREAQAVIDALRLFSDNWDHKVAIELQLVLALLLNLIRGEPLEYRVSSTGPPIVNYAVPSANADYRRQLTRAGTVELANVYQPAIEIALPDIGRREQEHGARAYVNAQMSAEFAKLHGNSYQNDRPPKSVWAEYRERVKTLGRFVEHEPIEDYQKR